MLFCSLSSAHPVAVGRGEAVLGGAVSHGVLGDAGQMLLLPRGEVDVGGAGGAVHESNHGVAPRLAGDVQLDLGTENFISKIF